MKDAIVENGELVAAIERSLLDGEHGLKTLPRLIKAAIKENAWQEYYSTTLRKNVIHHTFESFILEHPPDGLGSTIEQIGDMIRHDAEALKLYSDLITPEAHRKKESERSTTNSSTLSRNTIQGTTKKYELRRLSKQNPNLYQKVIDGELTVNKAAIDAGFRKKTATVVLEPDKIIGFIHKHFDQDDIEYIKDRL